MPKSLLTCCQTEQTALARSPWYHRGPFLYLITGAVGLSAWYLQYFRFEVDFNIWLSLASIVWAVTGAVADIHTTAAVFRLRHWFEKRSLPFPSVEENPLLPPYPGVREQLL